MKHAAILTNPQQAHVALSHAWTLIKPHLMAGHRLMLRVGPVSKSREQEEKYHAIIGEIAEAARKQGKDWDAEDWKRLLLEQFATDTSRPVGKLLPSLDGKRLVQTVIQSRKFDTTDAGEFIEWLHAWCATNGVELSQ